MAKYNWIEIIEDCQSALLTKEAILEKYNLKEETLRKTLSRKKIVPNYFVTNRTKKDIKEKIIKSKKTIAEKMYLEGNSQNKIAEQIELSQSAISKWVIEGKWFEKRAKIQIEAEEEILLERKNLIKETKLKYLEYSQYNTKKILKLETEDKLSQAKSVAQKNISDVLKNNYELECKILGLVPLEKIIDYKFKMEKLNIDKFNAGIIEDDDLEKELEENANDFHNLTGNDTYED